MVEVLGDVHHLRIQRRIGPGHYFFTLCEMSTGFTINLVGLGIYYGNIVSISVGLIDI